MIIRYDYLSSYKYLQNLLDALRTIINDKTEGNGASPEQYNDILFELQSLNRLEKLINRVLRVLPIDVVSIEFSEDEVETIREVQHCLRKAAEKDVPDG